MHTCSVYFCLSLTVSHGFRGPLLPHATTWANAAEFPRQTTRLPASVSQALDELFRGLDTLKGQGCGLVVWLVCQNRSTTIISADEDRLIIRPGKC